MRGIFWDAFRRHPSHPLESVQQSREDNDEQSARKPAMVVRFSSYMQLWLSIRICEITCSCDSVILRPRDTRANCWNVGPSRFCQPQHIQRAIKWKGAGRVGTGVWSFWLKNDWSLVVGCTNLIPRFQRIIDFPSWTARALEILAIEMSWNDDRPSALKESYA